MQNGEIWFVVSVVAFVVVADALQIELFVLCLAIFKII